MNFRNKLVYKSNRKTIKKADLYKIWNITNRTSINKTFNLLKELNYIIVDEKENIKINEKIARKGKADKMRNNTYTRIFSKNVQELYYKTNSRKVKQLANLFKVLPFTNFRYNIICSNPTENKYSKIKPLSWKDICNLCGYDNTKAKRLKKELMNYQIDGKSVIGEFSTNIGNIIVVNPKVLYSGSSNH